jgi:hypothetical protein
MPLKIRALSLESIVAKNPTGRSGLSKLRLEHPATILRRESVKAKPAKGPKPVKIRAEQDDT